MPARASGCRPCSTSSIDTSTRTLAAQAIGSSGSDQSRVFYLDKGSNDGLKPDMAVITADGIVGKVRDVFPSTAQVLVINDQTSGAGVILETTRIRGILTGNASGQLEMVGILADERIKPGEKVLTAGGDLVFRADLPVGVVEKVVRDPDRDAFIDVIVKPAAHLDRLDEVLVITNTQPRFSPQDQQDIATSEAVKGEEAEAIKDQLKASEIMAEHLPGLIDPTLPPDQQPLLDNSNPNPVAHPPQALHPDRFTPGVNAAATAGTSTAQTSQARSASRPLHQRPSLRPKRSQAQAQPATAGAEESIDMSVLGATFAATWRSAAIRCSLYALVPLAALVLQAWLPRVVGQYAWFDLPLVVTVYFALGRRSPIQGTIMGAVMGLFEDALSHHAIGINGIAKTVVGFLAASVGVRIDVENHTIRLIAQLSAFACFQAPSSSSLIAFCSVSIWSGNG